MNHVQPLGQVGGQVTPKEVRHHGRGCAKPGSLCPAQCVSAISPHTPFVPCPKDIPKQPPHLLRWVVKIKLSQTTEQASCYSRPLLSKKPQIPTSCLRNNDLRLDQLKASLPTHDALCAWIFLYHQATLLSTKWLKNSSPTVASAEAGASWNASQLHKDWPVQARPRHGAAWSGPAGLLLQMWPWWVSDLNWCPPIRESWEWQDPRKHWQSSPPASSLPQALNLSLQALYPLLCLIDFCPSWGPWWVPGSASPLQHW